MYLRKKNRKRLLILVLLVFGFIFWRGLKATTDRTHDCEFKLFYAVCVEKTSDAPTPGLWNILKTGVKF